MTSTFHAAADPVAGAVASVAEAVTEAGRTDPGAFIDCQHFNAPAMAAADGPQQDATCAGVLEDIRAQFGDDRAHVAALQRGHVREQLLLLHGGHGHAHVDRARYRVGAEVVHVNGLSP